MTVVQTDDDPEVLARRLGNAPLGSAIDLRSKQEPLLPAELDDLARQKAQRQIAERRAHHRQREAELEAAVAEAATAHHDAVEATERIAERRKDLLDGAFWCEGKRALVRELADELEAADAAIDQAAGRIADAVAAVEAAAAQRRADEAEIESGHRHLIELDLAGRSEVELRRELETARQSTAEADAAAQIASTRTDEVRAQLEVTQQQAGALRVELDALTALLAADSGRVVAALRTAESAPLIEADPASLRLADDLERLQREVAALPPTPPGPEPTEIEAAEVAAATARERLDALKRPIAPAEPPPWWDELARLHAAVVDAESAAGAGFARKSTRRRLEEALAAERAFLDEIGYPSHLDALMSGGRAMGAQRPGLLSVADAEQAVVDTEQHLFALQAAANAVAERRRLRSDLNRTRALGGALLGGGDATPERLRQRRPDPAATERLLAALLAVGCNERAGTAIETAHVWLTKVSQASGRQPIVARELAAVEASVTELEAVVAGAEADAADYASVAVAAHRQVEVLAAELTTRAADTTDPAERRALAEAVRQRIAELERGLTEGVALAERALEAARAGHVSATAARDATAAQLTEFAQHTADLADRLQDGAPDGASGDADLADLGDLAAALRSEVADLDLVLADTGRAVATAAAGLAHRRAALAAHQATGPGDPTAADIAEVLAEVLAAGVRATDLVVDPCRGLDHDGYQVVLDALTALGTDAPVIVLSADSAFIAWAIEQPARLVEVVSGRSVDPGLSTADRIDRAQSPT